MHDTLLLSSAPSHLAFKPCCLHCTLQPENSAAQTPFTSSSAEEQEEAIKLCGTAHRSGKIAVRMGVGQGASQGLYSAVLAESIDSLARAS